MRRFIVLLFVGIFGAAVLTSCKDEKRLFSPVPKKGPSYKTLKEKDDVFDNLLLAYERGNLAEYGKLFDEAFVFCFSQDDVDQGLAPDYWYRPDELVSAENMFTGYEDQKYGAITSIDLYLDCSGPWFEFHPEAPYQGEVWYQKTVRYSITAQTTSAWELQALHRDALFTVRFTEADGDTIWRIISWCDDIGGGTGGGGVVKPTSGSAVETVSWGTIKALYFTASP